MDDLDALFGDDLMQRANAQALAGSLRRDRRMGLLGQLMNLEPTVRVGNTLTERAAQGQRQGAALRDRQQERADTQEQQRLAREQWERQFKESQRQFGMNYALNQAQERRLAAQAAQDAFDIVPDPVNGGFVKINKRTGAIESLAPAGRGPVADTSGLPPSGLRVSQPGGKAPTEAEAKSGMRAGVSTTALQDIAAHPEAATPGLVETGAQFFGLPSAQQTLITGAFGGPERMTVRGAQDAFIDAALTEMTGAAYTEHQIAAFRNRFMPNYFDSPESRAIKVEAAVDFVRKQAQAAGRAWTPERDMQFRQMLQQVNGLPEGAGQAGSSQAQGDPDERYFK